MKGIFQLKYILNATLFLDDLDISLIFELGIRWGIISGLIIICGLTELKEKMINLLKMLSLSPETQQQNRSYKICEEQVQKLHRWNRKIKSHRGRAGGVNQKVFLLRKSSQLSH